MVPQNRLEEFAAHLEKNQTRHERWLWKRMRRWCEQRDLLCHPQIAMHGYIVDFYFPQINIAIELDGRQHNIEKDAQRDARLLENGVRVLRFPNPRTNAELNQVFFRIYAEARYLIKRAIKYAPGRFSTNPQDSQR